MDYFTKWPEAYTIPNKAASTVTEALVTNFFCHFGALQELHSDHGCNFECHLLQETLQHLEVSKTHIKPMHPQLDGMMKQYIKMVEKHLQKVTVSHQRDWDMRLPISLLAYRVSTHDTKSLTPANPAFRKEFRPSCDLLFRVTTNKKHLIINHVAKPHGPATQHPQLCPSTSEAGDKMKVLYNCLVNSTGYQEGDQTWLYCPTCTKGKSPKLQPSWEGPHRVVT
jgi:hypothetical protein